MFPVAARNGVKWRLGAGRLGDGTDGRFRRQRIPTWKNQPGERQNRARQGTTQGARHVAAEAVAAAIGIAIRTAGAGLKSGRRGRRQGVEALCGDRERLQQNGDDGEDPDGPLHFHMVHEGRVGGLLAPDNGSCPVVLPLIGSGNRFRRHRRDAGKTMVGWACPYSFCSETQRKIACSAQNRQGARPMKPRWPPCAAARRWIHGLERTASDSNT